MKTGSLRSVYIISYWIKIASLSDGMKYAIPNFGAFAPFFGIENSPVIKPTHNKKPHTKQTPLGVRLTIFINLPLEHVASKYFFLEATQDFITIETHFLCSGHPLIGQVIVSLADLPLQICITQVVTN